MMLASTSCSNRASPGADRATSALELADVKVSTKMAAHAIRGPYPRRDVTVTVQTPFRQLGSFFFFTSTAIEPSGFSGCSHAQATGFNTAGRISNWAERWTVPSNPFGSRSEEHTSE